MNAPDLRLLTRRLAPCLAIFGLTAAGPACVGFISGDDSSGEGETSATGDGDGDGDPGDGDGDGDPGDGDPGGEVTIYDIQQGMVGEGALVSVQGVIVTSPINAENGLVFVEEPGGGEYSGISLYLWDEVVMATQLQPGDEVDIVGEYAEFYDVSQIVIKNPGDISVVGSVESLPGPDVVAAADIARENPDAEPWEGVRVRINDAVIQEANDGFGQYVLVGDALVGNAFVDPLPQVQVNGSFAAVTGSLHYSFEEYKLMPATQADLDGYMGAPQPVDDTPIYDIQQGMVSPGSVVLLENVIASSSLSWSDGPDAAFFVQEPGGGAHSGIQVFVADTAGLQVAPGDDLTITGSYGEFFDMSQIAVADASAITVNSSGPAPAPELIADPATIATGGAMAEDYEGVLVRVENVTVTDENPDEPDEFGEFAVTGDLRVNDLFFAFADWNKPALGQAYASITGLLNYGHENFKLEPRDPADLVSQ